MSAVKVATPRAQPPGPPPSWSGQPANQQHAQQPMQQGYGQPQHPGPVQGHPQPQSSQHMQGTMPFAQAPGAPAPGVHPDAPGAQPGSPPSPGAPTAAPAGKTSPPGAKAKPPTLYSKLKAHGPKLFLAFVMAAGYGAYSVRAFYRPYEWSGTVEARQVTLGSRLDGRVKAVLVTEGDEVTEGQPLVVLETAAYMSLKTVAQADVESKEAELLKLESGAREQELQQARARVSTMGSSAASASALLAREELELKRARTLFASNAISRAELEQKEAAARAAAAEVGRASASTAEASAAFQLVKTGSRAEDIRIAKAALAAARAQLDIANGHYNELTIRAVRPSRVESVTVRPGDILVANTPAVKVLEAGQLYVRMYVPETQIGQVEVGQAVPITVDSFPGRKFNGKVVHINEIGEFTPRNMTTTDDRADQVFGARIALIDGQRELRAGMVAVIQVKKR